MYIRLIENGGGYAAISVHITGYQWGWRYAYPDSFYYKVLSNPISYGSSRDVGSSNNMLDLKWPDNDEWVEVFNKLEIPNSYFYAIQEQAEANNTDSEEYLISDLDIIKLYVNTNNNSELPTNKETFGELLVDDEFLIQVVKDIISEFREASSTFVSESSVSTELNETPIEDLPDAVDQLLKSLEIAPTVESVAKRLPHLYNDLLTELYFCRWWLKVVGVLELEHRNVIKNKIFQVGFWVTGQGVDPNNPYKVEMTKGLVNIQSDPLRLLRSTGSLILPTRVLIRFLGTSDDVTHSWAVPGIGLKMDCVPGRLFTVFTNISREGIYFGQCSELCGWNHYNMPISIYAIPFEHFIVWWELELHSIFLEKTKKYHYLYKFIDGKTSDYSLLNVKYK